MDGPNGRASGSYILLASALVGASVWTDALAQELVPPMVDPRTPNIAAVAAGFVPDYIGSDDYIGGAVPIVRYQPDGQQRFVFLYGSVLGSNLLDHPWLRTGPMGIYRFGRSDVRDEVVDRLPDVNGSLDLGWSLGAEWIDPENIARRVRIDAFATHDVTGEHDGTVAGVSSTGWIPIPKVMLLGLYGAVSWGDDSYTDTYFSITPGGAAASGLPTFEAGGGVRDARLAAVGMWPIGENWVVGAGLLYMRLLGDAADSPVTKDRGDANQLLGGIGLGYTW